MMKTIQDLVDKLNSYGAYGEYYIKKGKNGNYLLWRDEPEKKYNIIIGETVNNNNVVHWKTAYKKISKGVDINDAVREEDLILDDYQFTESEIEELKSGLPENMAKIIDLGKVEVKDEG